MYQLTLITLTLFSLLVQGIFHQKETNFERLMRNYENIEPSEQITEEWLEQPLDHFNSSDNRVWKMRYFQNFEHFKPNGPIFLYIGGEGPLRGTVLAAGMIYDLASETHGAMFASEHRYYGDSIPLNPTKKENLKYLSSRQALADIHKLLTDKKQSSRLKHSKVVVIGGSYAGNLAAWTRKLYPNLVDAVIASSAPLLAKYDFKEYLETVGDDLKKYGSPSCYRNIEKQYKYYDDAFKTEEGIIKLKKEENLCSNVSLNLPENQYLFVGKKVSPIKNIAQYGNVDKIKSYCNNSSQTLKQTCEYFDFTESKYATYHTIPINSNTWLWQVCTEFSYFQTTSSDKQPFGKSLTIEATSKMLCSLLYGIDDDSVRKSVERTNKFYGALHPNVTKVVFVNGELDPWHRLGILEDISEEAPAIFIPKASHCADLHPAQSNDPPEFTEARQIIKSIIKKWIKVAS